MGTQVRPEEILAELHKLWTSIGQQPGGAESQGVLRACSMTLIVVTRKEEDAPPVKQAIAELMRDHPSRAILLCVRPEEVLEARVSAECWLPFGRRQQICCEQIEIAAGERNLPDVPGLLLALAAPDLPVVVWCRNASLVGQAAFGQIAALAGRLILDSAAHPDPAALLELMAGASLVPVIADLSWTRLTRWREGVARVFENRPLRERLPEAAEVRVSYAGETVPAAAFYLAAWAAQAMRWEMPLAAGRIRFERVPEPAKLEPPAIQGFALTGKGLAVSVTLAGSSLEIQANDVRCSEPAPHSSESELLREELAITGRDSVYDTVLRLAARIAGREGG